MYLLNTSDYSLQYFADAEVPDYAILSHRWGKEDEEVLYRHIRNGSYADHVGFPKMRGCCRTALEQGWEFVWIDSCCIDKSSSVELSEAINSMYRFYRNAQVCYAYLNDVPGGSTRESLNPFRESAWFTRGWTLQELIAPRMVIFYDRDWEEIGTRSSLRNTISYVTGIHRPFAAIEHASIAEKMSWASSRKTLRIEDSAYCLLGLFGISMSPLYGEGVNAFLRLQLEIMNKTNDESIFAWNIHHAADYDARGLLAYTPAVFGLCGDIGPSILPYRRPPCTITNRGLRMDALLLDSGQSDVKIAVLDCRQGDRSGYLGVYLREIAENEYCRIRCSELAMCETRLVEELQSKAQQIFIRQYGPLDDKDRWEHRIVIDTRSPSLHGFTVTSCQVSEPRKLLPQNELELDDEAAKRSVLRTGELQADLEGQSAFKLRSQKGGPACALVTLHDSEHEDTFVLLIECVDGQVGANIFLLEDSSFDPLKVQQLFENRQYRLLYEHRADRVSRWMWSNRSVSVELLNLKRKDGPYFRGPYYLARLSVDLYGNLPWPDFDNDSYITQDNKLFRVVEKGRPQEYWAHTRYINFSDKEAQETRVLSPPSEESEDPVEAAKRYLARYEWCQRFFEWWPSRSLAPSPSSSPPPPPYMGQDLLSLYAGVEVERPSNRQIRMENIAESLRWRHDVQGRLRSFSDSDASSISGDDQSVLDSIENTAEEEFAQIGSPKLEYWQDGVWTKDVDFMKKESERQNESILSLTPIHSSKQKVESSDRTCEDLLDTQYPFNIWKDENQQDIILYSGRHWPQIQKALGAHNDLQSGTIPEDPGSEHDVAPPDSREYLYRYSNTTRNYDPLWYSRLEFLPPAPPYQLIEMFNIDGDVKRKSEDTNVRDLMPADVAGTRKRKREAQIEPRPRKRRSGHTDIKL